jgi:hypothetical protein
MRREKEFSEILEKLNNRLSLLENCVAVLEQRVAIVEDMNRLNEKKISRSLQELTEYGIDLREIKITLDSFVEEAHQKLDAKTS